MGFLIIYIVLLILVGIWERRKVIMIRGKPLSCHIRNHNWYYGFYAYPVWGRYERRCMTCEKNQYRDHKTKKYVTYEIPEK